MTSLNDPNATLDNNRATRWRLNQHGQLIDSAAASDSWDLADEIVRLKLGDVANDDDAPLRTPPKSKIGHNGVTQLADASPLDTTSSVGSSPHSEHDISISHSRGSSIDTTASSQESVGRNGSGQEAPNSAELKERPHSFSGGLSSADLRRLQQVDEGGEADFVDGQLQHQQWGTSNEQLSYPSLANVASSRPPVPPNAQLYDYRSGAQLVPGRDDVQLVDYAQQQRNFTPPNQAQAVGGAAFSQGRGNSAVASMPYRQAPRGFPQQPIVPSPTALGYPGAPQHSAHLSLGNSQQVYDMMIPPQLESLNPALARVQQQHNGFRGQHHHSTSDPSALRDAATLALLNSNMQFGPGMFPGTIGPIPPGMPLYANQYYGARDAYARPDPAAAMARIQQQYTGPYGMLSSMEPGLPSPSTSSVGTGQNGPSANNRKLGLYKTELCRSWEEKGSCRYGSKCQFAHGEEELRKVSRHPKYKTEICRTFWVSGSCPYGKRCCFIHTELPPSGGAMSAGSEGATPAPPTSDGRPRSMSTNSDPNEVPSSRLARISGKRAQEGASPKGMATPVNETHSNFPFTRPPTGTLRVDTSTLDGPSLKQNKSAYPTFASNGILLPAPDRMKTKSPAPVTAGPDIGRHNASRLEIVGYNQRVGKTNTPPSNHNPRSSMSGSEDLSGETGPSNTPPRVNGHVRAGSAGNWGSFSRSHHLASAYPHAPSPVGENVNSPWSTTELTMGSRFGDKAWA